MRSAVRVDIEILHTDGVFSNDPETLDEFTNLIKARIEDAIYEFAQQKLGEDVMMAILRQSVHSRVFGGLGPKWHPTKENETFIPGSYSAPTWNDEFTLDPIAKYDDGCRHVTVVADWS